MLSVYFSAYGTTYKVREAQFFLGYRDNYKSGVRKSRIFLYSFSSRMASEGDTTEATRRKMQWPSKTTINEIY